jgi:capsule polysaccharide export protein KpsC/LpsZ
MFSSHGRKAEFYKRLKLLPNVELVPININGIKLIKNSELVIVVDGSSGFEAILMGKPVVTMKYFIYSFMNLNETNYNINNLYLDIKNAIKKNKKISAKVLEKKVKRLIQSIISTSYTLRRPNLFYYNDKNFTLEDQKICGEDLAKAMIKELKITSR